MKLNDENIFVMYDGVCIFCSSWVKFIIRNRKLTNFKFIPLQTEGVAELIGDLNIEKKDESIIVFDGKKIYLKSDASLFCMKKLKFPYRIISYLEIFPRFIRNFIYDLVGRFRYKIFGKTKSCEIPSIKERSFFIGFDEDQEKVKQALNIIKKVYNS